MPTGDPIAVTLLEQDSYDRLRAATGSGSFLMRDGNRVYATQVFRTLGLQLSWRFTKWFPLIVVNGLPQSLTLSNSWLGNHSNQTNYPLESDLVDSFKAGDGSFKQDQIPGSRTHPTKRGVKLYGAGVYAFETGATSNWGAISFSYDDNKPLLGISWDHSGSIVGVTADLGGYKDLEDFFNKTAGKGGNSGANNSDLSIAGGIGQYSVDDLVGHWQTPPGPAVFVAVAPK